jgi:hypothetical protein
MSDAPPEATPAAWDSQAAVDAVRAKVQTLLLRETEIGLDQRGRITVDRGSTRVYINFVPQDEPRVVFVTLTAPVAFFVPVTPALFEKIARESDRWYFGHLCMSVYEEEGEHKGTAYVYLTETLVGDFLDPQELTIPVLALANTANAMDEDFVTEFGGVKYADS